MAGRVVLLFVDGLGVGLNDPTVNPCAADGVRYLNNFLDTPRVEPVPFGGIPFAVDASMGVPGLPQSATGQTALLTGVNAARLVGRHKEGFPNAVLRDALLEHSILKVLAENGRRPVFLNAYRPRFFEMSRERRLRLSATTIANLAADLPFRSLDDVKARRSIYQEFTNASLVARGFDVPVFTPEEAGRILARQATSFDFTLFEYFQTDRAGHSMDFQRALGEVRRLEAFLDAFFAEIRLSDTTVLVCGDHGNLEDISVKTHTCHPAMGIVWGEFGSEFSRRIEALPDVSPAVRECLCCR